MRKQTNVITRDEFIEMYCKNANVAWDELSKRRVVLPCKCGQDGCQGWAMILNDPGRIDMHIDRYSPDTHVAPV